MEKRGRISVGFTQEATLTLELETNRRGFLLPKMLDADQILQRIKDVVRDRLSFEDFESWFRDKSRNVHLWGDESLNITVDAIEAVLSRYHFETLRDDLLKCALAEAVRHRR